VVPRSAEVWPDTPTPLEYNSSLCNGASKPPYTAKCSYQPRRTHPTPDCGQPCADNSGYGMMPPSDYLLPPARDSFGWHKNLYALTPGLGLLYLLRSPPPPTRPACAAGLCLGLLSLATANMG
jgi:hypothetical protein